jgi:hypothetical protein
MKDRQDDGTLYTGDAREIWENPEYEPGSVKVCTFGYPLVAITDCETLKEKTVMRLLDELEKQPATRIKKKRLVASSRKKSRRG